MVPTRTVLMIGAIVFVRVASAPFWEVCHDCRESLT